MKKWIWIGAVAVVVIFFYATYNGFVNKEEGLKGAWADVETQYQRRADLIPNLVSTVKGYAAHETQTFTEVTEARAKATSIRPLHEVKPPGPSALSLRSRYLRCKSLIPLANASNVCWASSNGRPERVSERSNDSRCVAFARAAEGERREKRCTCNYGSHFR